MIKLYEKSSSLRENITKVSSCTEIEGDYHITLEESIFFPEEGGQNADTGKIILLKDDEAAVAVIDKFGGASESGGPADEANEIGDRSAITSISLSDGKLIRAMDKGIREKLCSDDEVRDLYNADKDLVAYKVNASVETGTSVKCILDYDIRYDRMQNHSGEHILTGVIHNKYGFDNVGFHLSDDGLVTLDINGQLSYEQVIEMEKEANRVIYANMPIVDSYPSKEELADIEYRSKIDIDGQVRLITIGDENETIDICACCAPHVARTGEVGIIKVISVINWKGGVRISMLAGRRALEYINSEHDIVRGLTGLLTTSAENLYGITQSHIEEIGLLKGKLAESLENNVIAKIDNEIAGKSAMALTIAEGKKIPTGHVEVMDADFPTASMKNIYNYLLEKYRGYVAVMAGDDENGYRYFGGIAEGDSRELATAFRENFDAKGGGKADMVQGQIMGRMEEIKALVMGML